MDGFFSVLPGKNPSSKRNDFVFFRQECCESALHRCDNLGVIYQHLLTYKKKYGTTCIVPNKCKSDPQLGTWVSTYRSQCKDKERIDLLDSIGFEWQLLQMNEWRLLELICLECDGKELTKYDS